MEVCAEHVVDVFETKPGGAEAVEPRGFWKIHRRRIALVLPGAGVDQDCPLAGAHHEGLVGDHQPAGRGIENERLELREMALADHGVIGREHVLRPAPRPVALDDAGDGDVANCKRSHGTRTSVAASPQTPPAIRVTCARRHEYHGGFQVQHCPEGAGSHLMIPTMS
jgi:hypothetical protein